MLKAMIKIVLVTALASLALLASSPSAQACSCVPITTPELVAQAERVAIARAGKEVRTKLGHSRAFKILHTFKGKVAQTFTWKQNGLSPCAPSYSPGDITVLFIHGASLSLCSGNYGSIQLRELPALIKASGQQSKPVSLQAMKVVLRHGLQGYLHGRSKIRALYEPLLSKSVRIGKSRITFGSPSKIQIPLTIAEAHTLGSLVHVSGTYGTEGVTFRVLLVKEGKKYRLLHKEVFES